MTATHPTTPAAVLRQMAEAMRRAEPLTRPSTYYYIGTDSPDHYCACAVGSLAVGLHGSPVAALAVVMNNAPDIFGTIYAMLGVGTGDVMVPTPRMMGSLYRERVDVLDAIEHLYHVQGMERAAIPAQLEAWADAAEREEVT